MPLLGVFLFFTALELIDDFYDRMPFESLDLMQDLRSVVSELIELLHRHFESLDRPVRQNQLEQDVWSHDL